MLDYGLTAAEILIYVGGAANIDSYSYCATRLRIKVIKENLVDEAALEFMPAVKGLFKSNGFYHLILGTENVRGVYEAFGIRMNYRQCPKYDMPIIGFDNNSKVIQENNYSYVCPTCGYITAKGYQCPICGSTKVSTRIKQAEPVVVNNNYYNPTIHINIGNLTVNGLTFNQIIQYNDSNQQTLGSIIDRISVFTNFVTYITQRDQKNDEMARDVIVILKVYSDTDVRMLGNSMQQESQVGRNPLSKLRRWILQYKDDVDMAKKFFDALSSAASFAQKWGPWLAKVVGL